MTSTRGRWTKRSATAALLGAPVIGLVVAVALLWQASYSAFTAATDNPGNNWAAGTVVLTDNDSNSALFSATGLAPGSTGERCIAVTSTGSLPSTVRLYATGGTTTKALSSYLNLTIREGAGAATGGSCSAFSHGGGPPLWSGTLASLPTTFGTGIGSWAPTGGSSETRTYRFTWSVDAGTPNSVQEGTAAITFNWTAQA